MFHFNSCVCDFDDIFVGHSDLPQKELVTKLKKALASLPLSQSALSLLKHHLDITQLLMTSAVRKPYGLQPQTADIYADATDEALWCWELILPQHYLSP